MSAQTQGGKKPGDQNLNDIFDSISLALDSIKRKSTLTLTPADVPSAKRRILENPIHRPCFASDLNSSLSGNSERESQIVIQQPPKSKSKGNIAPSSCTSGITTSRSEIIVPIVYTCPICNSTFPKQIFLDRHLALVHSKNLCHNNLQNSKDISGNALISEKGNEMFTREVCQISYKDPGALRQHLQGHFQFGNDPFVAPQIEKFQNWSIPMTSEPFSRQQHNLPSQKDKFQGAFHKCHHCFQNFTDKENLDKHILNIHHGIQAGWYHCKDCNQKFESALSHKKHFDGHATTIQSLLETSHIPNPKLKTNNECEKSKRTKSPPKIDFSSKLPLSLDKCCPVCPLKFGIQSELSSHVNKEHESYKSLLYVCDICGVIFLGTPSLLEHLLTLHGKKAYCTSCHRSFVTTEECHYHFRERGVCGACNCSFKNKCVANQHGKLHLTWAKSNS